MSFAGRIRAFLQNVSTLSQPQPWLTEVLGGSQSASGQTVTADSAMRTSAVYACVAVLAQSMGSLPLTLYKRIGERVLPAEDHPLYSLLKWAPNDETTAKEQREFLMTMLCLRGNSYTQIVRVAGQITELNSLRSDWTMLRRDEGGKLWFDYYPLGGEKISLPREQVWRNMGLSANGLQGLTPIQCAREAIGLALATEEQGARLFKNGMQTPVYAKIPGAPKPEVLDAMQERLSRRFGGSENAYKVPILQEGASLERVGLTAADSQFIESRKFSVEEIARFFRVPLHLINSLDRSTNNNIEHQGIDFVTHTLVPYATGIEQSVMRDLLLPIERRKYFVKFNFGGLLRGDQKSRFEAYASAITAGWMNRNEARELEELNRVDGLDTFLTPLSMGAGSKTPEDPVKDAGAN